MEAIWLTGQVDDQHQLVAEIPSSVPPGPVTVIIIPAGQEDAAGKAWMAGIAREWADELSDTQQDIYTLADGESVRAAG